MIVAFALPSATHAATLAELQAQVQALLARIATLQTQTAASAQGASAPQCPNLTRNLSRGMRGTDVTQLQQFLIAQKLLAADNATGFFGAMTEGAIKNFQCKHMSICSGSPAANGYGAVGPRTRVAIGQQCRSLPPAVSTPTTPTTSITPAAPLAPTEPPTNSLPQTGIITSPVQPLASNNVSVWVTSGDGSNLLSKQAPIAFSTGQTSGAVIIVDDSVAKQGQQIEGVRAAFTDASSWLISTKLDSAKRNELMAKLFSPQDGIGLSYVRQPIGPTDFSLSNETYMDAPTSLFSIQRDRDWHIVPLLKQALEINPSLKNMGMGTGAPAWMKSNNSLFGNGAAINENDPNNRYNADTLDPAHYGDYAQYLVSYVKAYQAEGLPIDAITVQNEPEFAPATYPGMVLNSTQEADFVKNHLGPAFQSSGIKTKIVVFDHNWDRANHALKVLGDLAAVQYIDGSGYHCYGGNWSSQTDVHNVHPTKNIYLTECSAGEWNGAFGPKLVAVANLLINTTRNWAKTVLLWNLALDQNHGPNANTGCPDCTGVVTIHTDHTPVDYTLNAEYYALAHVSKFVKPGARRIASESASAAIEHVAFLNPDGTIVLLALNPSSSAQTMTVRWREQSFIYTLASGTVATFVWSSSTAPVQTPVIADPAPFSVTYGGQSQDKVGNISIGADQVADVRFSASGLKAGALIFSVSVQVNPWWRWVGNNQNGTWTSNGTNYIARLDVNNTTGDLYINTPVNLSGPQLFNITIAYADGTTVLASVQGTVQAVQPPAAPQLSALYKGQDGNKVSDWTVGSDGVSDVHISLSGVKTTAALTQVTVKVDPWWQWTGNNTNGSWMNDAVHYIAYMEGSGSNRELYINTPVNLAGTHAFEITLNYADGTSQQVTVSGAVQ